MAIAGVALVALAGMMPGALDAKFWGVVLFGGSVMILGALPWLDQSPVKSIRYRPQWHKYVFIVFGICFVAHCFCKNQHFFIGASPCSF